MNACAERELALLAYYDGELDAAAAAEMDAHLAGCAGCRAELERVGALSAAVRRGVAAPVRAGGEQGTAEEAGRVPPGDYVAAPDTLRTAVRAAVRRGAQGEAPGRAEPGRAAPGRRRSAFWSVRGAAAAAVVVLATLGGYAVGSEHARSVAGEARADELLASHLRALLPGRLTDVVSSDRHQVKPWFAGRLDFAPPVPELAGAGFPLVGGRIDFFAGERAAAIVYLRRRHVIDLYVLPVRPDFTTPALARAGYSLVSWREGPLQLVAVSDVERADLELFARLHAEAARPRIAPAPPG